MTFFRKTENHGSGRMPDRPARDSRGWQDILAYLRANEALRVLDFGSTSSHNINYLTGMGHSVNMVHVVQDAARPEFLKAVDEGGPPQFDVAGFIASSLNFSGRDFDVVLLWDTAEYLPPEAIPALFEKLHEVLRPNGRLLALFHANQTGSHVAFSRYQVTDSGQLLVHPSENFPVQRIYQPRQIENFLQGYASTRFFQAKDNIREVVAMR